MFEGGKGYGSNAVRDGRAVRRPAVGAVPSKRLADACRPAAI